MILNQSDKLIINTPDGEVSVEICGIMGAVKLGINAPRHIEVDRSEIRDKKISETPGGFYNAN